MLTTLIVDDDPISLDITTSALQQFPQVEIAGTAVSGEEAIAFLKEKEVDLAFLDIEMDEMNGFELANRIHKAFPRVMYVFLTGHVRFALEGYDYQPLSFLTKPISISRMENVLAMAAEKKESSSTVGKKVHQLGIHVNGQLEMIRTDDVAYMETKGRKVHIVCRDHRELETTESMKKLAMIFEEYGFFRSHQSVLVNLELVESIRPDMFKRTYQLTLKDIEEKLPLSRDKKNELQALLQERGMQIL
jgi:DNA-binding LytR/AlgR family response regulator